tara:strand:- start:316 stop:492 length:177 start_codon:yes stop_codon:yes gene_type:complete
MIDAEIIILFTHLLGKDFAKFNYWASFMMGNPIIRVTTIKAMGTAIHIIYGKRLTKRL